MPDTAPDPQQATLYRGYHYHAAVKGALVIRENAYGATIGPLRHHVKHSPTGFGWGYPGSGASELARCLLIDALGDDAWCKACSRTGKLGANTATGLDCPYDPAIHCDGSTDCPDCESGIGLHPAVYQQFKEQFVGEWPGNAEWQISVAEILDWYTEGDWTAPAT